MRAALLLVLVAPFAGGCLGTPEGSSQVPVLDEAVYEAEVQPILVARCGNPTCHGRPERPFSIYGPERYREDPARTFLQEPLTDDEVAANYARACAFSLGIDAPTECLLLRKPLAVTAGGAGHVGGELWASPDDPEYRTVEAWLATARAADPGGAR